MTQQVQPQIYPLLQQTESQNVPMSQSQQVQILEPMTPAGNISSTGRYN